MVNPRNTSLRQRISALEKQLDGMSHGHIDRQRIIEDIKALALQLEQEHHWSVVPLFLVSVVAMVAACIAAYPIASAWFSPTSQEKKSGHGNSTSQPQSAPATQQSPDKQRK